MAAMKVLVCGGRDFADRDWLFRELDRIDREIGGISAIIHGCALGADTLAGEWATARSKQVAEFPADWDTHRRAAGPIRNKQMLDEGKPDLVVAFPGGRGTANMVGQARRAGVRVVEVLAG
jgi:cysteine synthase